MDCNLLILIELLLNVIINKCVIWGVGVGEIICDIYFEKLVVIGRVKLNCDFCKRVKNKLL